VKPHDSQAATNATANATPARAYAHSKDGRPLSEWEPLEAHLNEVAEKSGRFAEAFGMADHGYLAGLWHDLGKFSDQFQEMIRCGSDATLETRPGRVDHSTFGAQHAGSLLGPYGWLIAYCVAGHHGGLADAIGKPSLDARLRKQIPSVASEPNGPAPGLLSPLQSKIGRLQAELRSSSRTFDKTPVHREAFQLAFLTRMTFSALVDADSLCTERFYAPKRTRSRQPSALSFSSLTARLSAHIEGMNPEDTPVNRARAKVLQDCRSAALDDKGLFSLTVPTGGGKTLSSLAFALEHAEGHSQRRIVLAIPFTSIIEQNAEQIRSTLEREGEHVIVEHHSNLSPEIETPWSSMAAENWDAPIIVTTNVQLFESLFASSKRQCRKLHRLADSVIVLDEAQTLPVRLLEPCLLALRELVANYGCTIVMCTATQPAIGWRNEFPIGLEGVQEIVQDVPHLFDAMKRTAVEFVGPRSDEELLSTLVEEHQALCIVNTRRHAAELFTSLQEQRSSGIFHLSALMCAEHRSRILENARVALAAGAPCVLVSTQVVEAGVDIDFPIVLRAMAGIDSIAQAAGRCNREGRRSSGRVLVFETEERGSHPIRSAAADTRSILPEHGKSPLAPEAIEAYFGLHYWKHSAEWDQRKVMECFRHGDSQHAFIADFKKAASRFRMIDDAQTPIVVPHGDGAHLIEELTTCERPTRDLFRRLQRYTVGVYPYQLDKMRENQLLTEPHEGVFVLMNREAYDRELGLRPDGHAGFDTLIG